MRLVSIGICGVAVLGLLGLYFAFLHPRPAHLATLVPEDYGFGIFYRSLNDLTELYEGTGQRTTYPARSRVGELVNVPGFDGVAYDEPVGSYWTREREEVFLVPVVDAGAFEAAFEKNRERINLRAPHAAASNYLSVSEGSARASRGETRALVLRALDYPAAVCGHPRDADDVRLMLGALLVREDPRKPHNVALLSAEVLRLPAAVGAFVAEECAGVLLGVRRPGGPAAPLPVEIEASLRPETALHRAGALAHRADLAGMMATFPFNTVLCAGAVLDAEGWTRLGLDGVGAGAFALGIVEHPHHARRYTLLAAARPLDAKDLDRMEAAFGIDASLGFVALDDGGTEVRTAPLPSPPPWLEAILRSSAREAPPVYVSTAVEAGIWYCAVGAQAETVVRHCLGCLRTAPELGLQRVTAVAAHPGFLRGPHAALAMASAAGLKALEMPMPLVELASFGTPTAVTAVLDLSGAEASARLRLFR